MRTSYSIAEARDRFAALVHDLEHLPLIELTRRGQRVAVILSANEYQRLTAPRVSFRDAYAAFQARHQGAPGDDLSGAFDDVRDRSPGRPVDLAGR